LSRQPLPAAEREALAKQVQLLKGDRSWRDLAKLLSFSARQKVSAEALRLAAAGQGGTTTGRAVAEFFSRSHGGRPLPHLLTDETEISLGPSAFQILEYAPGRWRKVSNEALRWELSAAVAAGVPEPEADLAADLLLSAGQVVQGETVRDRVLLALRKAREALRAYRAEGPPPEPRLTDEQLAQRETLLRYFQAEYEALRRSKKKPRGWMRKATVQHIGGHARLEREKTIQRAEEAARAAEAAKKEGEFGKP
jgi:hypothetical protein